MRAVWNGAVLANASDAGGPAGDDGHPVAALRCIPAGSPHGASFASSPVPETARETAPARVKCQKSD